MLKNSIFDISPKKPANIVLTKKKMVIALVFLLALFSIYKVNKTGSLSKELFRSKIYIVLATIHDPNDVEGFNRGFTSGAFCGWQIIDGTGKISASENYDKTSAKGEILRQEFVYDSVKQDLSLCLNRLDDIDRSVKRQILGILMVAAIIIFIIYTSRFVDEEVKDIEEMEK
jgi:hypothetical protein